MRKRSRISVTGIIAAVHTHRSFADVRVLMDLHSVETSRTRQRSIRNAAAVMLVAHWESFVENIFEYCVRKHYADQSVETQNAIIKSTANRFHSASSADVNKLFLNVGVANILDSVRWPGMSSTRAKRKIDDIVNARHFIAHGQRHTRESSYPTTAKLKDWIAFIDEAGDLIAAAVQSKLEGKVPNG